MGATSSLVIDNIKKNEDMNEYIEILLDKYPQFSKDVPNYRQMSLEEKRTAIKMMIIASKMYKKGGKRSRRNSKNMRKSRRLQ